MADRSSYDAQAFLHLLGEAVRRASAIQALALAQMLRGTYTGSPESLGIRTRTGPDEASAPSPEGGGDD